jgi:hypothetical protein
MQQRRPHPTSNGDDIAAGDGGVPSSSREERRVERRLAKERRAETLPTAGGKRVIRVKRGTTTVGGQRGRARSRPSWKNLPTHVIAGLFAFGMFAFIGIAVFGVFNHGDDDTTKFHPNKNNNGDIIMSTIHNSDSLAAGSHVAAEPPMGGLLRRLRGQTKKYIIPESMSKVGDKSHWYTELRREYDTLILPKDEDRSLSFVFNERTRLGTYQSVSTPSSSTTNSNGDELWYDVYNCPDVPPHGYPMRWPVLDVLTNWPADVTTPPHNTIHHGICIFDAQTELFKAEVYRKAEVPFVMRDDPIVARTTERWNHPGYLSQLLMGEEDQKRRTEYSPDNHFMFWVDRRSREERARDGKMLRERKKHGEVVHAGYGRGDPERLRADMHEIEELNILKRKLQDAKHYAKEHEDDDEATLEVTRLTNAITAAKKHHMKGSTEEISWKPPTEMLRMTYLDWLAHANVTDDKLGPNNPHWYFRLIGCGNMGENTADGSCDKGSSEWLFDELPFFQPRLGGGGGVKGRHGKNKDDDGTVEKSFYMIEPEEQMGIHCRFGMKGVIAENHFDLSRNAIVLLSGRRRYILAHPDQCNNMNLLPRGHPSARHSAVDWSNPDLESYPTFADARVNEVVMLPGDVLYLPTNWFHFIVSLELNMQCNTRSGGEDLYKDEIKKCGF